jgi:hypothetical protein
MEKINMKFLKKIGNACMKFLKKIGNACGKLGNNMMNLIKNITLKQLEQILIYGAAIIIAAISVIWNVYSDTVCKISVVYLFFGALTGFGACICLFYGMSKSAFEIKLPGLIFDGVGIFLTILNIVSYFVYFKSSEFASLVAKTRAAATGMIITSLVFIFIALVLVIGGYTLQVIRKVTHNCRITNYLRTVLPN